MVLLPTGLRLGLALLAVVGPRARAWPYDPQQLDYNLNQNPKATNPKDYWGEWDGHDYTASPKNWRFPYYTLFLDRFVNGDPSNDNANGTHFEHDPTQTQLRHGGDVQGLVDSLDYIQGMGVKALYLAGSPFMNLPWQADSYSPVDFTLLDYHFGTIQVWRDLINEIHKRGMYVLLDNTVATMSDLLGFEGHLNDSAPFTTDEYKVSYKSSRQYVDFSIGNDYNDTCAYPRLYSETGLPVGSDVTSQLTGCFDSDFDQYGDIEAFGVHPDWQRELAKFASVQDRLREWVPNVRERIEQHACIAIAMFDIDGYRLDKAVQSTVDAQASFARFVRECAQRFGKDNFPVIGEITGGNTFGSIYIGRGRLSDQDTWPANFSAALAMNNDSDPKHFIREKGQNALDAAAFHYSIYRSMTRFLGMDGNLEAGFDLPKNWVDAWNSMMLTNDFVNPSPGGPGGFDPRHLYGVTNQDVFRWPAIANGTHRQLLGHFITALHLPGAPLLLWGEEQEFYVLDNTAQNYIYGRQSMSSAQAWQRHGCYKIGSVQYYNWPLDKAAHGCTDDWNSLDHRDAAAPVRNVLKSMFQMRENYPVLNDGFFLQQLSNKTRLQVLEGSSGVPTEFGIWSVLRSRFPGEQDLSGAGGHGNQSVWLVYHNENVTTTFDFDCANNDTALNTTALVAPFDSGTTVKNLFYPFEEMTLVDSPRSLGLEGSTKRNGCLKSLTMPHWGFAAYVPKDEWEGPGPMITGFQPGHDARLTADFAPGSKGEVPIELHFSTAMDCDAITKNMTFDATTEDGSRPSIKAGSVQCGNITDPPTPDMIGGVPSVWAWRATLADVAAGVHRLSVSNISADASAKTNKTTAATDGFLFRIGRADNPVVFPLTAGYAKNLVRAGGRDGSFSMTPNAPGADMVRYSFDWGSSFSAWQPYSSARLPLQKGSWTGTAQQAWDGEHVLLQYWSRLAGSSDHLQHTDVDNATVARRFPHLFWQGPYNQFGFDAGLDNVIRQDPADGLWKRNFLSEWPDYAQVNVWGINPDGQPDASGVYGDMDGDSVLDRSLPNSLDQTSINITEVPPSPFLAWQFQLDDATNHFNLVPVGSQWTQVLLFVLLALVPLITASIAVWLFMQSFYQVKFNQIGLAEKKMVLAGALHKLAGWTRVGGGKGAAEPDMVTRSEGGAQTTGPSDLFVLQSLPARATGAAEATAVLAAPKRRKVLIATMEYDIEDWAAKVKIGGLGVMAQLMGKNLAHQDLIWVVPKVGDIEYQAGEPAEPMQITIFGEEFEIEITTHQLRNITYVLLDAPVFRKQMKAEPYPPRMDDLESGVYYSAWNQAIAQAIERFEPDLYHINDYHGAVAPLHLLKLGQTVPVCLSLHNAEFQGLWPMRTAAETDEVCSVFNLPKSIVLKYVQFGEVFNLLHAGASYLRLHQQGFGAVGVSKKYGKRSFARYPIFWGLSEIGQLPNPDPSDTDKWDGKLVSEADVHVDPAFEAGRAELKRQAQEWAGLDQDPDAELMVFVGRWSMQKGVDLIADVFPPILERNKHVQIVCVGPVIDLYGRFAALKLARMMNLYPGRVFSKPEFTALPPYIFSGAEFALIPSRDEPFGLVAVEFGRKGALGVGARVGGLGQMPGWWYTVESTTTQHLLHQFRMAITEALASKTDIRAMMRARSAKQRFPVVQWVEGLETLQSTSIKLHKKGLAKARTPDWVQRLSMWGSRSGLNTGANSGANTPRAGPGARSRQSLANSFVGPSRDTSPWRHSRTAPTSRAASPDRHGRPAPATRKSWKFGISFGVAVGQSNLSLGVQVGPGHEAEARRDGGRGRSRERRRLSRYNRPSNRNSDITTAPPSRSASVDSERLRDYTRDAPADEVPPLPRLEFGRNGMGSVSVDSLPEMAAAAHNANTGPPSPHPAEVTISRQQAERALLEQQDRLEMDAGDARHLRIMPWLRDSASPASSACASPRARSPTRGAAGVLSEPGSPDHTPRPSSPLDPHHADRHGDTISPLPRSPAAMNSPPNWPLPIPPALNHGTEGGDSSEALATPPLNRELLATPLNREVNRSNRDLSMLAIVGERSDFQLQKVDPFFTDSTGEFYGLFSEKLRNLSGKNSEGPLCIEDYLVKVEKQWFRRFKDAKLGIKTPAASRPATHYGGTGSSRFVSRAPSPTNETVVSGTVAGSQADFFEKGGAGGGGGGSSAGERDEFDFGATYRPPTGLKRFMLRRVGDWPVYSFFLAFGQIIAANSYQITLLTGTVGQSAEQLYIIASVYLFCSICWWGLFRWLKCVYVLALPFFFYGLAFLFIGLAHFAPDVAARGLVQTVGTVWYAVASASGSIFFAVNFADEGGAPITAWLYRACVIQGTQSAYVIALWYWGAELTKATASGLASNKDYPSSNVADGITLTAITVPIAVGLWVVGWLLLKGLPAYYRQVPGAVPSFYSSIFRRRIILWFFVAVALQNFWLSAQNGRNWSFLWSSRHAPGWAIGLLIVLFFGGVWAAALLVFGRLSKGHSWILPLFAIGLGAPRWAQMLWATSGIGAYLPWTGGAVASALVSRTLWLWLGVLDSLQGVGLGMILLQTLTRIHICFTLLAAQVVGSAFTILARGVAPDNTGPGPVFPDFSVDVGAGLRQAWFWVALLCQALICVGFFLFFRKEQLSKP